MWNQAGFRLTGFHMSTTYNAFKTNLHQKRVLKFIIGLMQSPQWQQQPPWRIPVLKPSSNFNIPVAWILESATDS